MAMMIQIRLDSVDRVLAFIRVIDHYRLRMLLHSGRVCVNPHSILGNKIEDIVPVEELDECGKPISAVELLIQRIQVIQAELPHNTVSEEEQAFLEAAEDQIAALSSIQMRGRRG